MFRVDWSLTSTDKLLDELRDIAGAGNYVKNSELRPLTTLILQHCGGLPVATSDWSETKRTEIGRRLLHEAIAAMLRRVYGCARALPSCDLSAVDAPNIERQLTVRSRLDINKATEAELEALPVLGPALAKRTVAERRAGGTFLSLSQFAHRVDGVGASGARRLATMLRFEAPGESGDGPGNSFTGDFAQDFKLLLNRQSDEVPADRLLSALEVLITFTGEEPHPATLAGRIRDDLEDDGGSHSDQFDLTVTDEIEVLEDEDYYPRVRGLLGAGSKRIDVAMFFVAFPGSTHPTRHLLDRLVEAHDGGASVRVLVDRDREDDPYGSRIINAEAIAYLTKRGVPVRVDAEDQLLHSKFVVIDERVGVIGSHNWTAGSYFRYRDTSLAFYGDDFAQKLHARFDGLWAQGQEAS